MPARIAIFAIVAGAVLAGPAPGLAQDLGFCAKAKSFTAPLLGKSGVTGAALKVFDVKPGGTWCQYGGSYGAYIEKLPHTSASAFKAKEQGASTVPGAGAPAYASKSSNGYTVLSVLKGSTEIVIGAKVSLAVEKTVAKAVLALVH